MEHAALQALQVEDSAALSRAIQQRAFSRPPILDATRMIGFCDSDVARLLGCHPVQVSDWVHGKRRIPPVKHYALALLLFSLIGMLGHAPAGPHEARAKLLENTVKNLVRLALDEAFRVDSKIPDHVSEGDARDVVRLGLAEPLEGGMPKILPDHVVDEGIALADQMLHKLGGYWLDP